MGKKIEAHFCLGYTCNSHCKHCVVQVKRSKIEADANEKDLTTEQALEHITGLINRKIDELVLTGGEPTIRSDIKILCKYVLENGLNLQIQTNGINTQVIQQIVNDNKKYHKQLSFMIPLHSTTEIDHNYVTGNAKGFKNTINTLNFLQDSKISIIGKIVLTRFTGNLKELIQLYANLNAKRIIIAYPHCVSFKPEKVEEIDLHLSDIQKKLLDVESLIKQHKVVLQGIPFCFASNLTSHIQEWDKEYLERDIIECKYKDPMEYQWHTFRKRDKLKFKKCAHCEWNKKCEGIWKEYIHVFGEE